jgi:hypothetical protein
MGPFMRPRSKLRESDDVSFDS